jgi:hypothetical protein
MGAFLVSYFTPMSCPKHESCPEHCPVCLREARRRFHFFHCFSPPSVMRIRCRRLMPTVLVHLGQLRGLIYSSDRGNKGYPKTYIHFMQTPPKLACDPQGNQLYIIGGRYRVTTRGIEG